MAAAWLLYSKRRARANVDLPAIGYKLRVWREGVCVKPDRGGAVRVDYHVQRNERTIDVAYISDRAEQIDVVARAVCEAHAGRMVPVIGNID